MAKRTLIIIGLLIIGAIANISIAWAWAAWGVVPHDDVGKWSSSHPDPPLWVLQQHSGAGASIVRAVPILAEAQFGTMRQLTRRQNVDDRVGTRFSTPPTRRESNLRFGFDERGWPLRCLRSEHRYRVRTYEVGATGHIIGDVEVSHGIQLWPEQSLRGGWALQRVRAVPLQPIWIPLIVNTMMYAMLAGVLLLGYPAMIRMLGRRRSILGAAIAMALAPALVVGVAWLAAWKGDLDDVTRINGGETLIDSAGGSNMIDVTRQDRFGGTRLVFSGGTGGRERDLAKAPPIDGVAPSWAMIGSPLASRTFQPFAWLTVEGVGWPARAMRSAYESSVNDADLTMRIQVTAGVLLDPRPQQFELVQNTLHVLPTQIIWRGLLSNSTLYATVLFGVIAAPGAIRLGLRRRRGRCPNCGYNLRGEFMTGCPECGWRRTPP